MAGIVLVAGFFIHLEPTPLAFRTTALRTPGKMDLAKGTVGV